MPATVKKVTGPLSYIVRTMDNQEWRRHKNQLRVRHIPDTQCSPQNGIEDDLPHLIPRNPIAESPTPLLLRICPQHLDNQQDECALPINLPPNVELREKEA